MSKPTVTVPGCAPQLPEHERIQPGGINPANSWAAAMEAIRPPSPPRIPETSVQGLPAFRCEQAPAPRGKWQFLCTCKAIHVHSGREGQHVSQCEQHRPYGYWLLPPYDFIPQQTPANSSSTL